MMETGGKSDNAKSPRRRFVGVSDRTESERRAVRAAREMAHLATSLASEAATIARVYEGHGGSHASITAAQASIEAAQSAFVADARALGADASAAEVVRAADRALDAALRAVQAAKQALALVGAAGPGAADVGAE